jgi:predicted secreted hydrolase
VRRRGVLLAALAPFAARAAITFPQVVARPLVFPRDHGSHPDYRIEWWYLTAVLDRTDGEGPLGVQVTFFRVRTTVDPANPSRFAAHQLAFAHAALAEPARGNLRIDQRIERIGPSVSMAEDDMHLVLDRWRFARRADGRYESEIPARGFRLRFVATPTQPVLLQGNAGFSPKQREAGYASYYYSEPQLHIEAEIAHDGTRHAARGTAWLDHEWSSALLAPDAGGWDWIGMNLDDGSALTAFRIRGRNDAAALFAYASLRAGARPTVQEFSADQVRFEALEHWQSPRTHARYPIAQRVTIGRRTFETRPLLADQELDARLTSSALYWEGASLLDEGGRTIGRGYLELTGYASPLRL